MILPTEQISRPHVETDEKLLSAKRLIPSPTATALIKDSSVQCEESTDEYLHFEKSAYTADKWMCMGASAEKTDRSVL